MVFLHGQMEEDMKAIMLMIKKRVTEYSIGPTVENMKVAGKMENNMELEHTPQQVERPNKENGKKERGFIGYRTSERISLDFIQH